MTRVSPYRFVRVGGRPRGDEPTLVVGDVTRIERTPTTGGVVFPWQVDDATWARGVARIRAMSRLPGIDEVDEPIEATVRVRRVGR